MGDCMPWPLGAIGCRPLAGVKACRRHAGLLADWHRYPPDPPDKHDINVNGTYSGKLIGSSWLYCNCYVKSCC
jgi:hypothetical protein